VALELVFPPVLLSSPVSIIPPMLPTFIYMLLLPEGQKAEAPENPPKLSSFGNLRAMDKGKCKVHPRTGHEVPEGEKRYSSSLSLTSALDGEGGQRHAPAPGKETRYPLYKRLGGPQGWSGREISPPPEFDPPTRQALASRYTD